MKTPTPPPAARALAKKLGIAPMPAVLRFTLRFHAPKQGTFTPPPYQLFVDTSKTPWLSFQNYNEEPRALQPSDIQVPIEMTTFTIEASAAHKKALSAWAKALLAHE